MARNTPAASGQPGHQDMGSYSISGGTGRRAGTACEETGRSITRTYSSELGDGPIPCSEQPLTSFPNGHSGSTALPATPGGNGGAGHLNGEVAGTTPTAGGAGRRGARRHPGRLSFVSLVTNSSADSATQLGRERSKSDFAVFGEPPQPLIRLRLGGGLNALAASPEWRRAVVAGREVLKILAVGEYDVRITQNLRVGCRLNVNFSTTDVKWGFGHTKEKIITAATSGAVVIWDLNKAKVERLITEHSRAVNSLSLFPSNGNLLVSASQDGTMKLWDLRARADARCTYDGRAESVRDVQFNACFPNEFAAAYENGQIQRWDIRATAAFERKLNAHNGLALTVDWHPEGRFLASGGRDKMIKVWDMKSDSRKPVHVINTMASVSRVAWRPGHETEIASCALLSDYAIHVWDVRRPYIAKYSMAVHESSPTGLLWVSPDALWSCSKDRCFVRQDVRRTSYRPLDCLSSTALSWNVFNDMASAIGARRARRDQRPDIWEDEFRASSPAFLHTPLAPTAGGTLAAPSGSFAAGSTHQVFHANNNQQVRRLNAVSKKSTQETPPLVPQSQRPNAQVSAIVHLSAPPSCVPVESFAWMADNYVTEVGDAIGNACSRNAAVAWLAGDHRASRTWTIMQALLSTEGETEDSAPESFLEFEDSGAPARSAEVSAGGQARSWDGCFLRSDGFERSLPAASNQQAENQDSNPSDDEKGSAGCPSVSGKLDSSEFFPAWDHDKIVGDVFKYYEEQGNVQMCATLKLVFGDLLVVPGDEQGHRQEEWFSAYIELLHRLQLFSAAAAVISACPVPSVRRRSQESTTIHTSCSNCFKPLGVSDVREGGASVLGDATEADLKAGISEGSGALGGLSARKYGFWACGRCNKLLNPCSVCHLTVRGLYIWCQGCSHGGHLACLQGWYLGAAATPTSAEVLPYADCPSGCGHACYAARTWCSGGYR